MLALPHAETIVGLCAPVFQVAHDNFVTGIIALHAFEKNFTLAAVHLRMSYASLGVDIPRECGGSRSLLLPGNRIELAEDVTQCDLLFFADAGIEVHHQPGVLASAPVTP